MKRIISAITNRKTLISAALVSVGYALGVNPQIIKAVVDVFAVTF